MSKEKKDIPVEEEIETKDNLEKVNTDSDNISDINTDENLEQESQEDAESLTLDALKRQLEHLKQKADSNYDLALRAKAELDNVRRRSEKEVATAHKYALEKFIPKLLPILDSLDQGMLAANTEGKEIDSINSALAMVNSVKEGMQLTLKMFEDTFSKFGVEVQYPLEQKFDPHLHQAVMMQPDDTKEPGTIIKVLQKGYILNKRVIRPAMVVVVQEK